MWTKETLIKALQDLPDGIRVVVGDYKKNLHHDSGDGSSEGLYSDFEIDIMDGDEIVEGTTPFASLTIDNDDY